MYSQKDIEKVRNVILEVIEPYRIILFGSYATGKQNDESDIDLMILLKEDIIRKNKLDILYRIEKKLLYLKYNVDIVLKNWQKYEDYKDYIGTINYDVAKEGKILWMKK